MEKTNKAFILIAGLVLTALIGLADFLTGYELAFSVFYVLPIFLVTWFAGSGLGFLVSATSAVVLMGTEIAAGHPYSHPLIAYWNTFIRFFLFIILTQLVSALRSALQREREHARIDYLTGAVNKRFFYEVLQIEIDRLDRYKHPFTVAYFDLDNFKNINDRFGHASGDRALQLVVKSVQKQIRRSDTLARIGGDEFALLLPETDHAAAQGIFPKLRETLLADIEQHHWSTTFSIGALTCTLAPHSAEILIQQADDLMYRAKRRGKNTIEYGIYAEGRHPLTQEVYDGDE
jgi:diguanylate cyclase (GGDEF)-like protein